MHCSAGNSRRTPTCFVKYSATLISRSSPLFLSLKGNMNAFAPTRLTPVAVNLVFFLFVPYSPSTYTQTGSELAPVNSWQPPALRMCKRPATCRPPEHLNK